MSLTIDDVRDQVARVSHVVDGIGFTWGVTYAAEFVSPQRITKLGGDNYVGFFIQVMYLEPDVDDPTGKPQLQQGRKWFVAKEANESEVIQTMLKAALASAEHRVREHFLVDGLRAYGPHQGVELREVVPVLRNTIEIMSAGRYTDAVDNLKTLLDGLL